MSSPSQLSQARLNFALSLSLSCVGLEQTWLVEVKDRYDAANQRAIYLQPISRKVGTTPVGIAGCSQSPCLLEGDRGDRAQSSDTFSTARGGPQAQPNTSSARCQSVFLLGIVNPMKPCVKSYVVGFSSFPSCTGTFGSILFVLRAPPNTLKDVLETIRPIMPISACTQVSRYI